MSKPTQRRPRVVEMTRSKKTTPSMVMVELRDLGNPDMDDTWVEVYHAGKLLCTALNSEILAADPDKRDHLYPRDRSPQGPRSAC